MANINTQKKKVKVRRILILLVSVLVIVAGILLLQFFKYKVANKQIKTLVLSKSKGLYRIDYSDLFFDEVAGILQLKNVSISVDTNIYKELEDKNQHPEVFFKMTIPVLRMTGVKTARALLSREIVGGKTQINKPEIEIIHTGARKKVSDTTALYKQILGDLKMIKLNVVEIVNATITVKDIQTNTAKFKGSNVSFILQDLIIDSLHSKDSSRILFSKNISMKCEEAWMESRNKRYTFHLRQAYFNSENKKLAIGKIHLNPKLSETAFLKKAVTQTDRLDMTFENISFQNIDPQKLMQKRIVADELLIGKSNLKIYRDLSYPRDKTNRVGTFPHQVLMKLPVKVEFKKVLVRNTFIEYKEKNPLSNNSGKVQFHDVNATITNVTNDSSSIVKNSISVLNFNSNFLNKSGIKAELIMHLSHPNGKFSINGTMDQINAQDLNALAVPMGMLKIEKGVVNTVEFNLNGNDYTCEGTLKLLYNDLKVSLLEKEGKEYDRKNVTSFIANMMVKNDNPKDGEVRQVKVHQQRDINRSFFSLIWKTIFSGVKETVGMK